jgi:hypothetical protein
MTECQYCLNIFSSNKNLKIHQNRALYCLKIQGKENIIKINREKNKCISCGHKFSTKFNLNKHTKICNITINADTIVNQNIAQQNINNNININLPPTFTISDLTPAYIEKTLKPLITQAVLEAGMSSLTEVISDGLLQKDGQYCYYSADRSRKKFMMLVNNNGIIEEQSDPESFNLRSLICKPLYKISLPISNINLLNNEIEDTVNKVKNLNGSDGNEFKNELNNILPPTSQGFNPLLRENIMLAMKNDEDTNRLAIEIDLKREKLKKQGKMKQNKMSMDELLDNCETLTYDTGSRLYWHKLRKWIVRVSTDNVVKIVILGYASKKTDKMMLLTKTHIETITKLGLKPYLDLPYLIED